jgi:hypothetical protein
MAPTQNFSENAGIKILILKVHKTADHKLISGYMREKPTNVPIIHTIY